MEIPKDNLVEATERLALKDLMDAEIPRRMLDENLLIASWNIQQFSNNKSWRALKYMADIIERFDIVAIQEIKSDLRGLRKLQHILPGRYKILVSDVTGNTERFAFIFDERSVEATGLVAEIGLLLDPKTHRGFQIHRMPYCASFRCGRFDFTIVSVHIFESNHDLREKEIELLAEEIVKLAARKDHKVFDPDFFVVGDFNIEHEGDRFFKKLTRHGLRMPKLMDTLKTNFKQTKTLDKIGWVPRDQFKFKERCGVVAFNKAVFVHKSDKEKGGQKQISDHLPLWAEFEINELTQQLEQIINELR